MLDLKLWTKEFWQDAPKKTPTAFHTSHSGAFTGLGFVQSFDGEKNLGAIGPVVDLRMDYYALNLRSWEAYVKSEIAQAVLNRYILWVVDKGLKLNATPNNNLLEMEGITVLREDFNDQVEARFMTWAKSMNPSDDRMRTLNQLAKDAFKNAKVGGDVLVVLRLTKTGNVTVQLIDGANVVTPLEKRFGNNRIKDGIERDESGRVIKYHVRVVDRDRDDQLGSLISNKFEEIEAINKTTGLTTAFMVFGSKYRENTARGLPIISTTLETISKLDRYQEAMVGSAEERAKIVYQVVHQQFSDGESHLADSIASGFDVDSAGEDGSFPVDEIGNQLANQVAVSTDKQTFNMPKGAKLESLQSQTELFFETFYSTNANLICSAIGIPPNVAFSLYDNSYSASRAATKDWDHTIEVERDDFRSQFYQPIYNFWLHFQIVAMKIQAPGYLEAFANNNSMIIEAYRCCRFTGPSFPHIDPVKEVTAERLKLGTEAAHIPLTSIEAATENLNGGDSTDNLEQFVKELETAKKLGLEPASELPPTIEEKDED